MKWHDFIFSKKKSVQFARHIFFWTLWWLYFFGSRFFYPKTLLDSQPGISKIKITNTQNVVTPYDNYWETTNVWSIPELIRSLLMFSIHIIACYITIYFLLRFLLKTKYSLFVAGILLLACAMILSGRMIDTIIIPYITGHTGNIQTPYYASIFAGVINAIKIIVLAVGIKLAKHWWFKQKEKERLEKEKIDTELQLLRTRIHPQFLFNTLNNIYLFSLSASPKAPEMLLKLSDILSYMLYDCSEEEVLLTKEIKMIRDYVALEKIRYGNKLEMNIQVKTGAGDEDKIAPMLLLAFVENSFHQSDSNLIEQAWLNLEIKVENHVLEMKLMNGKSLQNQPKEKQGNELQITQKRLQLLYPGRHLLKITDEPEIMIIVLQLLLNESTKTTEFLQHEGADKLPLQIAGAVL